MMIAPVIHNYLSGGNTSKFFKTVAFLRHNSTLKQSKILSKLMMKPKKRKSYWQPDFENVTGNAGVPLPSAISKGSQGKKRTFVLNKLFMRHITDLMSTGQKSDILKGFGIEITKVSVTSDYQIANVYWSYSGNHEQTLVEDVLRKTAGDLRCELSSLRVMGQVPKILFVRDRSVTSWAAVDALLKTINLEKEAIDQEPEKNMLEEIEESLPPMRQDIFGLNRDQILHRMEQSIKNQKAPTLKKTLHSSSGVNYQILDQATFTEFLNKQRIIKEKMIRETDRSIESDVINVENRDEDYLEEFEEDDYIEDDDYDK